MKGAYVTLLYGDNAYFIGTLVFIKSLLNTKPKYDTVLLHTYDVPKYKIDMLRPFYTVIKEIKYISCKHKKIMRKRFVEIFTKLKIFTLIEYDKILFMDNDMYVNKNIDHLFDYNAPAGMAISENLVYKDGEPIKDKHVVINAGLWLLKPSCEDYDEMLKQLPKFDVSKELEQEYVSYFYETKWTNMSYLYNYQFSLNEFLPESVRTQTYNKTTINDVYVVHYSTSLKPWDYLLEPKNLQNPRLKQGYQFYKPWFDLFKQLLKHYSESEGFSILHPEGALKDPHAYLLKIYKNIQFIKLTPEQITKFRNKLNSHIPHSGDDKFTYSYILDKIGNNVYLAGGVVRNLFNDEPIKDVDAIYYGITSDEINTILKQQRGLQYIRGKVFKEYFKIGDVLELELMNIVKLDSDKNSLANSLLLDMKTMTVIDIYGNGVEDAVKLLWRKPPEMTDYTWLNMHGNCNVLLGRLIKFIMLGYKTIPRERTIIYEDWYYNKELDDYSNVARYFAEDSDGKYAVIERDVDKLRLKFTGKEMVAKIKLMINSAVKEKQQRKKR